MVIVTEFGCAVQAYVDGFCQLVFPRPEACPHCHTLDVLIGHGFYHRKALEPTQTYAVRVKRWYCNACHGTTSLLPSFLFSFRHYLVVTVQQVVVARYEGQGSWAAVARACAPQGAPDARTIRRWCDAFVQHAATWLGAVQRTLAEHDAASPLLDPLGQTAGLRDAPPPAVLRAALHLLAWAKTRWVELADYGLEDRFRFLWHWGAGRGLGRLV
jgi:hypothetical protein